MTNETASPTFTQRDGSHKHDWSIPLYCPDDEYFGGTHDGHVATWICDDDDTDDDPDCWVDVPFCCERPSSGDKR